MLRKAPKPHGTMHLKPVCRCPLSECITAMLQLIHLSLPNQKGWAFVSINNDLQDEIRRQHHRLSVTHRTFLDRSTVPRSGHGRWQRTAVCTGALQRACRFVVVLRLSQIFKGFSAKVSVPEVSNPWLDVELLGDNRIDCGGDDAHLGEGVCH